uniref:Neurotransmitter-gated ion-channel ligand-binding domain-containing protein n=1 Tax=Anopheles culicifacies TaxID=139723 RepID=A0A182M462_9DIPT
MKANCVIDAGYHEKRLLHHLLDNYNVLERPVVNESDPLQLSFGLTLMQIIDVVSRQRLREQKSGRKASNKHLHDANSEQNKTKKPENCQKWLATNDPIMHVSRGPISPIRFIMLDAYHIRASIMACWGQYSLRFQTNIQHEAAGANFALSACHGGGCPGALTNPRATALM